MKTLKLNLAIILIVLAFALKAQNGIEYLYCDEFYQFENGVTICKDANKISLAKVQLMTIELFWQYKQECYRDSTFTVYDWYQFPNDKRKYNVTISIDPGHDPGYLGRWGIWEHKQPTFEDFLDWVLNEH